MPTEGGRKQLPFQTRKNIKKIQILLLLQILLKMSVTGKLQKNSLLGNSLKAAETILNLNEKGYKLPFVETPESRFFANNTFAERNEQFVSESLAEFLKDNSMIEAMFPMLLIPCM